MTDPCTHNGYVCFSWSTCLAGHNPVKSFLRLPSKCQKSGTDLSCYYFAIVRVSIVIKCTIKYWKQCFLLNSMKWEVFYIWIQKELPHFNTCSFFTSSLSSSSFKTHSICLWVHLTPFFFIQDVKINLLFLQYTDIYCYTNCVKCSIHNINNYNIK